MKKTAKLTLKQAKWIKEYLKTGNATRSAEKVYDVSSYKSASVIASENLEKLRPHVAHLMEAKNVSIGRLIDKLDKKLDAKKIHGTSDDFIEIEDNVAQLKALEIAGKWIGLDREREGKTTVVVLPILSSKSVQGNNSNDKIVEAEETS